MSAINIGSSKKKKKTTDSGIGLDKEKAIKESIGIGQKLGLAILALAIATGTYFFTKSVLVPDIAIWAREIISLILSLLALAGFSAVSKEESKIGGSVVIFLFAIFIWQMVSGYSDYDLSSQDQEKVSSRTSSEVRVRTLYPKEDPYVFHLSNVGDETESFNVDYVGKYDINFNSSNYGFEIIYLTEGRTFKAQKGKRLPGFKNPVYKLRAVEPNQYINVRITPK